MDVPLIEMERPKAREAFLEYRRAVRAGAEAKLGAAQREYQKIDRAVMAGYRALADGKQLLTLSTAIADAGTIAVDSRRSWVGERQVPRLAVCRADSRHVWTAGVDQRGGCRFYGDRLTEWAQRLSEARSNVVDVADESFGEEERNRTGSQPCFRAIVPTIPPPFRPEGSLSGYHLLWEAEWTGIAPVDPMLLRHLGGDLYAVLAVWDLTPLEQAVLGGLRA